MKKTLAIVLAIVLAMMMVAACGGGASTEPKTYTASTETDQYGNNSTLAITYDAAGKITDVKWEEFSNGTLKDENYGKDMGDEAYTNAQISVNGSKTYGEALKTTGDISKVEAVSGATQSYNNFLTLYNKIREQIKK